MTSQATDPRPRPSRDAGAANWRPWFGPVAFVVALTTTVFVVGVFRGALAAVLDVPASAPGIALGGTVVQDLAFVVAALLFAAAVGRVAARDFGLVPIGLRRLMMLTVASTAGFLAFFAAYGALVSSGGKQETLVKLGADRGGVLLVAAGALVVILAPFAEEFFFRGFFYRALRNRFMVPLSALINGSIFGVIHFDGSSDVLVLLPLLAVFGALLCILYEITGSLYPSIAVHVVNHALAFGSDDSGSAAAAAACAVVGLTLCAVLSRPPRAPVAPAVLLTS